VTAAATATAIAGGAEDVVLYTDLANATSNAIYQAIGYRPTTTPRSAGSCSSEGLCANRSGALSSPSRAATRPAIKAPRPASCSPLAALPLPRALPRCRSVLWPGWPRPSFWRVVRCSSGYDGGTHNTCCRALIRTLFSRRWRPPALAPVAAPRPALLPHLPDPSISSSGQPRIPDTDGQDEKPQQSAD
jgi:hypothetical protein